MKISTAPPVQAGTSLPKPLDPAKAQKANEASAHLQQALQTVKSTKNSVSDSRKAAASQRIARLKESLKTLRQTPGLDPKTMARMAARMAKELASAIKEYKEAGGTDSAVSADVPVTTPVATSSTPEAATPADVAGGAAAVGQEPVVATPAEVLPSAGQASAAYEKAGQIAPSPVAADPAKSASGDDAFIKDAKDILDQLRNLLKMRPKAQDKAEEKDMLDAEKELDQAARDLGKIALSSSI